MCSACSGRGGYNKPETQFASGPVSAPVYYWVACIPCGGTGQIFYPDSVPTSRKQKRSRDVAQVSPKSLPAAQVPAKSASVEALSPEQKQHEEENAVAGFFMLATWVAIGWHGVATWSTPWYWPVGVALVAGIAVYRILAGPLRIIPKVLVWGVKLVVKLLALAVLAALLGGLIYLVTAQESGPQPVAKPLNESSRGEPRVGDDPVQPGFGANPPHESNRGERSAGRRNRLRTNSEK